MYVIESFSPWKHMKCWHGPESTGMEGRSVKHIATAIVLQYSYWRPYMFGIVSFSKLILVRRDGLARAEFT
jgi:hypothetical protein